MDYLFRLVELPTDSKATIKMLTATNLDGQHSMPQAKHHTNTKETQTQNVQVLNPLRKLLHQTEPQLKSLRI